MKILALPIIAGALSLYGSAFFEIWTAPGLESLPTYKVVTNHLPWGAPEEVAPELEPESSLIPISESVQFLPHGCTASWGNVPVIELPDRKPEQAKLVEHKQSVASKPAPPRPAARRPAVRTPKVSSKPATSKPSTSYHLAGSRVEYRR